MLPLPGFEYIRSDLYIYSDILFFFNSMSILKGKIALVTGASEGIGAAICRELVKQGMTVLGCARNKDLIEAIGSEEEVRNSSGKLIAMG